MLKKIIKLARRPAARYFGGGGFDNHNGLYPNRLGIYAGAVYTDDIVPGLLDPGGPCSLHQR